MGYTPVLIYFGGSTLNLTYTKDSDIDIVVTCLEPINSDYMEVLELNKNKYSILFNSVKDYEDCSHLSFGRLLGLLNFTHFDSINHFSLIWTSNKLKVCQLIEKRKQAAMSAVYYLYKTNSYIVDDFLECGHFNKELYHYAHAYFIVFSRSIDYSLLLEIKQGKHLKILRTYLKLLFQKGRMFHGSY